MQNDTHHVRSFVHDPLAVAMVSQHLQSAPGHEARDCLKRVPHLVLRCVAWLWLLLPVPLGVPGGGSVCDLMSCKTHDSLSADHESFLGYGYVHNSMDLQPRSG